MVWLLRLIPLLLGPEWWGRSKGAAPSMVCFPLIPNASFVYCSSLLALRLLLYYSLKPFILLRDPVDPSTTPFLLVFVDVVCFFIKLNSLLFDSRFRWRVAAPASFNFDDSDACWDPRIVETPPPAWNFLILNFVPFWWWIEFAGPALESLLLGTLCRVAYDPLCSVLLPNWPPILKAPSLLISLIALFLLWTLFGLVVFEYC